MDYKLEMHLKHKTTAEWCNDYSIAPEVLMEVGRPRASTSKSFQGSSCPYMDKM